MIEYIIIDVVFLVILVCLIIFVLTRPTPAKCTYPNDPFQACLSDTGCHYNFSKMPAGLTNLTSSSSSSPSGCLNSISGNYNIGWLDTNKGVCYTATEQPQFTEVDSTMVSDPNFTMWIK